MIQRRNSAVESLYLNRLESYLNGDITLPSSRLNKRPPGIHQSDLNDNSCILKGYYANTLEELPPMGVETILKFATGRFWERGVAFSGELEPKQLDRIWVTPDDYHPDIGISEIKHTISSSLSDVRTDFPQWVCQMKNQAYVFEEDHVNLIVMFVTGNTASFAWDRGNMPKGTRYRGVAFIAWTFEFTEAELEDNWKKMVERRDLLESSINDEIPIHRDIVLEQLPCRLKKGGKKSYWMCEKNSLGEPRCGYSDICYLKKELIK